MSTEKLRCQGTNAEGERCGVPPSMVGDDGFCAAHRPGGSSEMARRGTRGAYASQNKDGAGLKPEDLPDLETHADAKRWLQTVGRAVATKRLSDRRGQAVIRAVSEWVKAHEGELTALVVDELKGEVERLQRELEGRQRPRLSAAE